LPVETSALTINRFCSSGLQSIAMAAERIMSGGAEVIVAGGTESMSMIPMGGHKVSPNPWLVDHYPDAYLNMGSPPSGLESVLESLARRRTNFLCAAIRKRWRQSRRGSSMMKWLRWR